MNVGFWNNNILNHTNQITKSSQKASEKKKATNKNQASVKEDKKPKNFYETITNNNKKLNQADKTSNVQLSEKAQNLLKELKKKYSNMDFFVANYDSEEEAQRYLRQGKKEFSVLIDPELLEEMAADEETMKKYDDILSNAGGQLNELKEKLPEDAGKIKNFGISISKDGKVSYFVELEKMTAKQREHIEKTKEKREEEREEERIKKSREKPSNHPYSNTKIVSASSIEELLEKLRSGDEKNEYSPFDVSL